MGKRRKKIRETSKRKYETEKKQRDKRNLGEEGNGKYKINEWMLQKRK